MTNVDLINHAMQTERPDLDALADSLGIRIVERDLHNNICGWMTPSGNGSWEMVRNAVHRPARRRFTTAHMIGHHHFHLALMGDVGCNDSVDYRQLVGVPGHNPKLLERHDHQASRFAVRIVMPDCVVTRLRSDGLNVFQIADRLEASVQGVKERLDTLRRVSV